MKAVVVERVTYCRRTRTLIRNRVVVLPDEPSRTIEHVELRYEPKAPARQLERRDE